MFIKEDTEAVLKIQKEVEEDIKNLQVCRIINEHVQIDVSFEFHLTMVDGKVCNILSENKASSKCFICGALPKEMNTPKVDKKLPDTDKYKFGLSSLHCWIKSFDCLIHIAYRL